MADPEKTDPNFAQQLGKATDQVKTSTAKADPWADRFLRACQRATNWAFEHAIGSAGTPWIIVAITVVLAYFAYRVARS